MVEQRSIANLKPIAFTKVGSICLLGHYSPQKSPYNHPQRIHQNLFCYNQIPVLAPHMVELCWVNPNVLVTMLLFINY
ncbi:hypothetical protein M6B38_342650 [Iris pallida]|uniref:Uncharacterized protein n=1 Tax=Iris pallida TaxID=29817 RepID=A0AAX6GXE6_IRIPA|nr:hypothetical protein M6B38_342650 [Iris pallida]